MKFVKLVFGGPYIWKPFLNPDYSEVFSTYCDKYPHYFDAAKGSFGINNEQSPLWQSYTIHHHCVQCFTALEEDLSMPRGFYVDSGDTPVVFDSGWDSSYS